MYNGEEMWEQRVDIADITYDLMQLAGVSAQDVCTMVGSMFETGRFEQRVFTEECSYNDNGYK